MTNLKILKAMAVLAALAAPAAFAAPITYVLAGSTPGETTYITEDLSQESSTFYNGDVFGAYYQPASGLGSPSMVSIETLVNGVNIAPTGTPSFESVTSYDSAYEFETGSPSVFSIYVSFTNGDFVQYSESASDNSAFSPTGSVPSVQGGNTGAVTVDNGGNFTFHGVTSVSVGSLPASAAVPEPTGLALLGLGFVGAAFVRRRHTAAA